MRLITKEVVGAFVNHKAKSVSNTSTDGTALFLHGNRIAEWRDDGLWITNAGWKSLTTKERLQALPGVSLCQKAGVWYLNGKPWNGSWIKV